MLSYGQKSSVDYYQWLEGIPRPRQVWLDFGYQIRYSLPGNVPVMQLIRDPEHNLGFDQGRFSVYPMFADISDLHREQGDPRPFGSVWWDGMNRHAHVQQMKFYPECLIVFLSLMITMHDS